MMSRNKVSWLHCGFAWFACRNRQEIEARYYKEWEELTLIPEEELNRKMTPLTFIKFLPKWFRFYGLPAPLRFLLFRNSIKLSK